MGMNTIVMLENSDGTSGLDEKLKGTDGSALVVSPAAAPGSVSVSEETTLDTTDVNVFSGETATAVSLSLKEFGGTATAGGAIYYVFNSATPGADLNTSTVRRTLYLGDTITILFSSSNPATSLDYASAASLSNTVLSVEWK